MNATREVTIYQQINDPVSAIETFGKSIAQSKIFGCQNEAQGQVLALECMARGLSPLSLAEKYDIIQGKLSMKSDAMLAGFEEQGGKYEVKEYSPDACEIIFSRGSSTLPLRITWEDAQKEAWPYGKENELKHNWSTPIGRQDMLWARVVSRGVRRLAPGVVCGRYTPEEIVDFTDSAASPTSSTVEVSETVDAEFKVVETKTETEPTQSDSTQTATSQSIHDPVSPAMVDRIKSKIADAAQLGVADIPKRVKEKLLSVGLQKLEDLTVTEAETLISAIETKALEAWLTQSIEGHAVGNAAGEQN